MVRFLVVACVTALFAGVAQAEGRGQRGLKAFADDDMVRAHLLLEGCKDAGEQDARREAKKRLERGRFAPVAVDVSPPGATVAITSLGETFVADDDVWLPFGKHAFTAQAPGYQSAEAQVEVTDRSRLMFSLRLRRLENAGTKEVRFDVESPTTVKDPKPTKFDSLLDKRFRAPKPGPVADDEPARSKWPWLLLGTGVALAAGGTLVAMEANSGRGKATAVGLFAAGAATTGVGIYLFVRPGPTRSSSSPGDAGVGLVRTW